MNLRTEIKRILNEYLSGTKISELPTGSALTGPELLEAVQNGVNIKITVSQLTGGSIPVTEFVQLTDVPSSYAGFGGYKVKVKADETGLEFVVDSGGGGGSVDSVVSGSGITIDDTDPANPIVNLGGAINQDVEIYPNVDGNFGVYFGVNSGGTSYAAQAVISSRSFSTLGFTDGLGNFADINFSGSGITITAGGTADSILVQTPAIFADTVTLNADPANPLEAATKQYVDANVGTTYTFSTPLSETAGTVSIQNAAADGTTKGAAAFTANDFNATSGVISIDYTNGQAASGSTKGFLTSADWTTFNNKQSAITFGTGVQTALGVNIGSAGAVVIFNGAGGTPSSLTLTNATGLPISGITGLGTGVATFLATPSWTNFNSMITGTAPFWSLASGGTLTGVNTITSNTANQLIYGGTYTTTANSQYYLNINPTITARGTASDDIYGLSITPSIVYGANGQTGTAIFVNVTTTPGAFTSLNSNFALFQAAGTTVYEINANGTIFLGSASSNRPRVSIATTSGSASPSGLTVRVSGAVTSAASTSVLLTTGNTSVTITNSFSANIVNINSPTFSPSSGAYNWCWLLLDGALGQSGSATGVIRGINYNPTGTWVGAHYGLTIGSTAIANIFNGLNTQTPNSTLQINGSFAPGYVEKTGTYTITAADYTVNCTSGSFTVTLPTAVGCQGRIYVIKNSGAGTITLATTSSQTIDGAAPGTVAAGAYIALQSTNGNWIKIS